jgi:preprotein translocase subunit SecD
MKTVLKLALAVLLPFGAAAQTAKKLPTGIYEIVPKSNFAFKDEAGKTIYVLPTSAVTIKNGIELIKDYEPMDATPMVFVKLDSTGTAALKKLTGRSIGKKMAIIAGGQLISTPMIRAAFETGVFPVSNRFNNTEADRMKVQLQAELENFKQVSAAAKP